MAHYWTQTGIKGQTTYPNQEIDLAADKLVTLTDLNLK